MRVSFKHVPRLITRLSSLQGMFYYKAVNVLRKQFSVIIHSQGFSYGVFHGGFDQLFIDLFFQIY